MPAKIFQDDALNNSSFRVAWLPFIGIILLVFGLMTGLFIHEIIANGDYIKEWFMGMKLTGGAGLSGFLLKIINKWVEKKKPAKPKPTPEPATEPQAEIEPMVVQHRIYEDDKVTLSRASVIGGEKLLNFVLVELPWKNNEVGKSRIPAGLFDVVATRKGGSGYYAIWFPEVIGRTEIMCHIANYVQSLLGCLAPGLTFKDINNDGIIDAYESKKAIDKLAENFPLGTKFKWLIEDKFHETGNIKPM